MRLARSDGLTCICTACEKQFELTADADDVPGERAHLRICSCESGGVYDINVVCPHCDHKHSLY